MNPSVRLLLVVTLLGGSLDSLRAHGVGAHLREQGETAINEVVDSDLPAIDSGTSPASAAGTKSFQTPVDPTPRKWGASFATGWQSRNVHYGMDETGYTGNSFTEVSVRVHDVTLSVWNGVGLGNAFLEWNFTAAYQAQLGPVFLIPGYNFRYQPGMVGSHSHDHPPAPGTSAPAADHFHAPGTPEHDHEPTATASSHSHDDGAEHNHGGSGHSHKTYGHELFAVLGTTAIPYVTPSATFVADLNNLPGMFLELRLDGEVPLYRDLLRLEPYAQLGLNFGYNTTAYYGWNNFQYGANLVCRVHRHVSVFAGIQQSVALAALRGLGQGNITWVNAGVTFTY